MKKTGLLIVFFIYLFAATEFHQLLKIPVLMEHYSEHKNTNTDLSFLKFLMIHYAFDNSKYPDYDKDMKLPFKSSNHSLQFTSFSVPVKKPEIHFYSSVPIVKHEIPFSTSFISAACLSAVWQPPRT